MTKFKKQKALLCKLQKKIKGSLFHCREVSDHKYWWSGKTLSVLSKSVLKTGSFFIRFLTKVVWKLAKLKSQNFKSCMFFLITWIFYQLTDLCSSYAIQLNQMSVICEVWKNYPLKCGFRSILQKYLKDVFLWWVSQRTWNFHEITALVLAFKKMYCRVFCFFRLSVIKMA